MNTKEQWEEDIQKRVNDIAYSHPKSGKEATENRNKILEIIRETREQAYQKGLDDGYGEGFRACEKGVEGLIKIKVYEIN
jgi:flagellar biosynthesis/type III secretory pathway protein FliH